MADPHPDCPVCNAPPENAPADYPIDRLDDAMVERARKAISDRVGFVPPSVSRAALSAAFSTTRVEGDGAS